MSAGRLLEAFVKILGVYYAVSAVQQLAFLLALWRSHPPREFNVPLTVIADAPVILSKALIAAVLLYAGSSIVRWLVGREGVTPEIEPALSRPDLLYVGTCVVGLVFLLMAIPDIGRFAVLAFWYAGADRQAQAGQLWTRTTVDLLMRSGLGGLAGLALVIWARPVTAWLEGRANGDAGPATDS
ncbi:MAG: hypothetical protein ACM3NQ_25445 [Bacteroidales bacterium]